jgi:CubicO group peptidase (beta-lactamase class C family)
MTNTLQRAAVALTAVALTVSGGTAVAATPDRELRADLRQLDRYLRDRERAGEFSGSVAVTEGGRSALKRGYGDAIAARHRPNTPQTKFCFGSMGKMLTGVAVAQQVQKGKIAFEDTIESYIPELPAEIASRITIHQLLTHTAGLGDSVNAPGLQKPATLDELVAIIAKAPPKYEPGMRYAYSNDGIILAGAIVERVSDERYNDYVARHILKPAGMRQTGLEVYRPSQVRGMALGYRRPDGGGDWLPNDDVRVPTPAGGGYSTVGDMLRFANALLDHKLLSAELVETIWTGKVEIGGGQGSKAGYGFGERFLNGQRIVGHNGGSPGYSAQLDIYPGKDLAVVMLTNQEHGAREPIRHAQQLLTD